MSWRDAALGFMRVPPTPTPPPGSPPRVFRAAPNFFTLRMIRWSITQAFAVTGLVFAIMFHAFVLPEGLPTIVTWIIRIIEFLGVVALIAEVIFGWMLVRLDYELRWYMLSDRAIRIREGIATVREKTIALANIQNIAVRQGPLQRYFGIADVEVKTAGGGGGAKSEMEHKGTRDQMHVAYFRGVDNAEEIRDLLREGVRLQRDAGLGDPDEPVADDAHAAVAELLAEARLLRKTIAPANVPPPA
jgi:uncharacterized membrane protein YdbT with pleckstrin-like domain